VCAQTPQPFRFRQNDFADAMIALSNFWQDRRPLCPKTYGPRLFGVLLEEPSESRIVSHRLGSCDHMSAFTAKCPAERTGKRPHFERYLGQSRALGAL
jgi:hypothetical protein